MSKSEYGPSWYDCATLAVELRSRWSVSTTFVLVPPIRKIDGTGNSPWSFGASLQGIGEGKGRSAGATQTFGPGGAWKTATAAIYAALVQCDLALSQPDKSAPAKRVI